MSSRIADVKGTKESSAMLQAMQLLFSSIYIMQNKPAVVGEKFVKIVTGLPGVPVTEELNLFENEYSKNQLLPPILIFY